MTLRKNVRCKKKTNLSKAQTSLFMVIPILLVAILCYTTTSYAWFALSAESKNNIISATSFSVDVLVTNNGNAVTPVNGSYSLTGNTQYTVILIATGSATGYCIVSDESESLYTDSFSSDKSFQFTLIPVNTTSYTFKVNWGTPPQTDISTGDIIGTFNTIESEDPGKENLLDINTDDRINSITDPDNETIDVNESNGNQSLDDTSDEIILTESTETDMSNDTSHNSDTKVPSETGQEENLSANVE